MHECLSGIFFLCPCYIPTMDGLPTPNMTSAPSTPSVVMITSAPTTTAPAATTAPTITKVNVPARTNVVMDFGSFLQQQNLVGLALSFLVAFSTMDATKGFTRSIIMPLIEAIKTLKAPSFAFGYLIEGLFNFVITMLVVFFMLKLTRVAMPPAQIVQVMTR